MDSLDVRDRAGGSRISVHVQPRAARSEVVGLHGTALKVRLAAPPVDGAANDALVLLLAEVLGVSRRAITVTAGHASRSKIVDVDGASAAEVRAALEHVLG